MYGVRVSCSIVDYVERVAPITWIATTNAMWMTRIQAPLQCYSVLLQSNRNKQNGNHEGDSHQGKIPKSDEMKNNSARMDTWTEREQRPQELKARMFAHLFRNT